MTFEFFIPTFFAKYNSGKLEQSAPAPSSYKIFNIYGLGHAFTAKYSLNLGNMLKHCFKYLKFSRIDFSSYI